MRQLLLLFLIFFGATAYSQNLETDGEVRLLEGNIHARRYPRTDASGNACALILVRSTDTNLQFWGNVCEEVRYDNATYYVYMSPGSNKLEITHGDRNRLTLKFPGLASKSTYEVTVGDTSDKGYINLTTSPSGANVYMMAKGERISLGRTPIKKTVTIKTGTYTMEIEKQGYRKKIIDKVKINKNKTTKLGNVKLKAK